MEKLIFINFQIDRFQRIVASLKLPLQNEYVNYFQTTHSFYQRS